MVDKSVYAVVGEPRIDYSDKRVVKLRYDDSEFVGVCVKRYNYGASLASPSSPSSNNTKTDSHHTKTPPRSKTPQPSLPQNTIPSTTASRRLKVSHIIPCLPSGYLLSPTPIDFSALLHNGDERVYVMRGSEMAGLFSKCYYVGEEVYDAFFRNHGGVFTACQCQGKRVGGREKERARGWFGRSFIKAGAEDETSGTTSSTTSGSSTDAGVEMSASPVSSASPVPSASPVGTIRVMLSLATTSQSSRISSSTKAYLQCRIVSGSNLKAMDMNGFSDPYAVVYIVDDNNAKIDLLETHVTHVRYKTCDPYWNCLFDIGKDVSLRVDDYTLVVEVYDHDSYSTDDFIGYVKVPLWNLPSTGFGRPAVDLNRLVLHPGGPWIVEEIKGLFKGVVDNAVIHDIAHAAQRKTINHLEAALNVLGAKWREKVCDDYYMPGSVRNPVGLFIDRIWCELQVQIMQIIKGLLNVTTLDKYEDVVIHNHIVCCKCSNRLTSWYRYHMAPFDKSIWGKFRDPVFVMFFVVNMIPYLGFQTVLFTLRLIMIERKDDFQCISFIESFKGLQFVQGLFLVLRGVLKYMECAGLEDVTGHTCDVDGPGVITDDNFICSYMGSDFCFWIQAGEFIIKVFLAYTAFFLLAKSVSLGGKIFLDHRLVGAEICLDSGKSEHLNKNSVEGIIDRIKRHRRRHRVATIVNFDKDTGKHSLVFSDEEKAASEKGETVKELSCDLAQKEFKMLKLPGVPNNVMNFLFWWDVFVFAFFGAVGGFTIYYYGKSNWMTFGVIYWCRTFYQLFSLPFLVLKIPGLKVLLTHAKETGYKPNGTLVLHKKKLRSTS
jgi:hypothetical protein